jgi:hypothetical protein
MTATTMGWTLVEGVVTAAAVGMVGIALFQLAIAAGAPLGPAAWGGNHPGPLPAGLRIASGVAVIAWTFAALVVLRRGGMGLLAMPDAVARWGTWIIFGFLVPQRSAERRVLERLGAVLLGAVRVGPRRPVLPGSP